MNYYFLQEDFEKLNAKIEELRKRIKAIGREMGESCREGAETFHDNFAYEDGERNQAMFSRLFRKYVTTKEHARLVQRPEHTDSVNLGSTVEVKNESGEIHKYKIGSYLVFSENTDNTTNVSYTAPIAKLLKGARVGEKRTGIIGGSKQTFSVISISI